MIYRDMPQDAPLTFKQVVLPVPAFEEVMVLAHVGESVLNMQNGAVLSYNEGKYYATTAAANLVFFADNPIDALTALSEWMEKNGETGHNHS